MREKERKRAVREQLGSVRVLELGFNKITILPLKMSKLTKQGLFMFQSSIQIPAGTADICRYEAGTAGISTGTKHRGQPYRIAGWYGIFRSYRSVRYGIDNIVSNKQNLWILYKIFLMTYWSKYFQRWEGNDSATLLGNVKLRYNKTTFSMYIH